MRLTLWASSAALMLAACSGANDQTTQPENSQTAAGTVSGESAAAQNNGPDAMRFMQRFDKNKDGVLEIAELPPRMQKWLGKADTNGDGKLSQDELRAHAESMKKEHFARMDKNSDGALTADELGDEKWEHLKVADANSDGRLTADELSQAFASGKLGFKGHERWAERGEKGEHGKGRMMRLDTNQDGALSADEVGSEKWAHISVADANGDGKVTFEELRTAHENGKLQPMKRERTEAPAEPNAE